MLAWRHRSGLIRCPHTVAVKSQEVRGEAFASEQSTAINVPHVDMPHQNKKTSRPRNQISSFWVYLITLNHLGIRATQLKTKPLQGLAKAAERLSGVHTDAEHLRHVSEDALLYSCTSMPISRSE